MKIRKPNNTEKNIIVVMIAITFGFFIGAMAEKHQSIYKDCHLYHDYDNLLCEEIMGHLDVLMITMENDHAEKEKLENELKKLKEKK